MDQEVIDRDAAVKPVLANLIDAKRWVGISPSTLKRLAEREEGFPKLIRVAHRITLFDVEATADYLRKSAGAAPRVCIRGKK